MAVAKKEKNSGGKGGLIAALVLVSLLLAALVVFVLWQYNDLKVERTRLETKEAICSCGRRKRKSWNCSWMT